MVCEAVEQKTLAEKSLSFINLDLEKAKEMIENKSLEEYQNMISQLSFGQQWFLIKFTCDVLCKKENKTTLEGCYRIADTINDLIATMEAVDKKGMLSQILYQEINSSRFLVTVVSCIRTENYVMLNERYFGEIL